MILGPSLFNIYTHMGERWRAGGGVESQDGLGDERTEGAQTRSGTEWYCVGQRAGHGESFQMKYAILLFARLLRLVTSESTCSKHGRIILDIHNIFTYFVGFR